MDEIGGYKKRERSCRVWWQMNSMAGQKRVRFFYWSIICFEEKLEVEEELWGGAAGQRQTREERRSRVGWMEAELDGWKHLLDGWKHLFKCKIWQLHFETEKEGVGSSEEIFWIWFRIAIAVERVIKSRDVERTHDEKGLGKDWKREKM